MFMYMFMLTSNILVIMTYTTTVSFWNIPFQFIGTVFVMQFQEISHGNELIFWEGRTLKFCRELGWENVCDCQLGICSKLHTSSQINKTTLCHCNYVCMYVVTKTAYKDGITPSWYASASYCQWLAKWVC